MNIQTRCFGSKSLFCLWIYTKRRPRDWRRLSSVPGHCWMGEETRPGKTQVLFVKQCKDKLIATSCEVHCIPYCLLTMMCSSFTGQTQCSSRWQQAALLSSLLDILLLHECLITIPSSAMRHSHHSFSCHEAQPPSPFLLLPWGTYSHHHHSFSMRHI